MFDDLFKELRSALGQVQGRPATRVITVAKPFCSPARDIITGAFQPYGVKLYGYREEVKKMSLRDFARRMKLELKTLENLRYGPAAPFFLPMAVWAYVEVSEQAAAWAEYLLLRTGKLYVPGEYVNRRNAEWAARHGGQMPPAWQEGKPWIEASCSEGVQAWQPVKDAAKRVQTPTKRGRNHSH